MEQNSKFDFLGGGVSRSPVRFFVVYGKLTGQGGHPIACAQHQKLLHPKYYIALN